MSYGKIAIAKMARKIGVSAAGRQVVQKIARCGARYNGVVDLEEMNVIYDERKAP